MISLNIYISDGYIITHCTCIYPSLDPCFFSLFLFECLYQCSAILLLIVILYVLLLIHVSLSVSVYGYHISNFGCIGTSLDSYFFLSHSLWRCLPVCDYTITHCRCIRTPLDPSFSLCFSESFYYCSAIYFMTDCTCICTSLDPPLSFSVCLSIRIYYR